LAIGDRLLKERQRALRKKSRKRALQKKNRYGPFAAFCFFWKRPLSLFVQPIADRQKSGKWEVQSIFSPALFLICSRIYRGAPQNLFLKPTYTWQMATKWGGVGAFLNSFNFL
jgi:hypothetical protein